MSVIIGGRYKLTSLIGRGGMADVYLALDTILNREVAIKILKSEMASDSVALERFAREARASARLVHPNIVEIYDIGDEGDKHYIVMEYIKGYTLKKLIDVRGAIPYRESVWMIKQLSLALLEAHKKGIVHRDVKSQNVLIKSDGTVKMADFGIAQTSNDVQITKQDTIVGSVHYLAPELAKGKPASMQSDIYALGIVFYELLTGTLPYKGDSAVSIALKHVNNEIPSVREINSEIPQSIENIVIKATAKDPNCRYKNIAYLIKDLEDCLLPEHANDRKVVITQPQSSSAAADVIESLNSNDNAPSTKEKITKRLGVFTVVLLAFASIAALLIILFLSGVISLPGTKFTTVPNITGLSIADAQDVLDDSKLSIDLTSIEREMTEDVPEGKIISFTPGENEKVYKNSEIRIVVSSGMYSKMEDFVGKNKKDVEEYIKGKNIKVEYQSQESDKEPGTILEQSIEPNQNFDPSKILEITFVVSKYKEIYIENIRGNSVEDAQRTLEELGAKVELVQKEKTEFTQDEQLKYPNGFTVIRVVPGEGSYYVQDDESTVKLYYYMDAEVAEGEQ